LPRPREIDAALSQADLEFIASALAGDVLPPEQVTQ
jgi:hypothetical protein